MDRWGVPLPPPVLLIPPLLQTPPPPSAYTQSTLLFTTPPSADLSLTCPLPPPSLPGCPTVLFSFFHPFPHSSSFPVCYSMQGFNAVYHRPLYMWSIFTSPCFCYTCQQDEAALDHIEGKNGFWSGYNRQKVYCSSRLNDKRENGWHLCSLVWDWKVKLGVFNPSTLKNAYMSNLIASFKLFWCCKI